MDSMQAIQVVEPGQPLELAELPIPEPGDGEVRIRVHACGICHSDALTVDGEWPGIDYPRVPGHEIVGVIDKVGPKVDVWKTGQRVGVGWHGGHCGHCVNCRRGDFGCCENLKVPGVSYDGGYAEYMIAPTEALVGIHDDLAATDAAPLLCAGITTYNSLRRSGAQPGDVVAILGVGGVGHLGVQFARKMGFVTVAISLGKDTAPLAEKLGAHHYIDAETENVGDRIQEIGGARVILATAPSAKAMSEALPGLGINGKLIMIGWSEDSVEVPIPQFIVRRNSVQGWSSGTSADSQDTLKFSIMSGVRPIIEEFPLARVNEAYQRAMSGEARFRVVLNMMEK